MTTPDLRHNAITNPIAHGLRGLPIASASLPGSDPASLAEWMASYEAAVLEGRRINDTEGIDALMRAIVDEERAGELEAASDAAQAAHDAADARLLALETVLHALDAFTEAAAALGPEDKPMLGALLAREPAAWLDLKARVAAVRAEVSRLEDVAHEAAEALRAYEEVET